MQSLERCLSNRLDEENYNQFMCSEPFSSKGDGPPEGGGSGKALVSIPSVHTGGPAAGGHAGRCSDTAWPTVKFPSMVCSVSVTGHASPED